MMNESILRTLAKTQAKVDALFDIVDKQLLFDLHKVSNEALLNKRIEEHAEKIFNDLKKEAAKP